MDEKEEKARAFVEHEYRTFHEALAAAELEDRDFDQDFLDGQWIKNLHLPAFRVGIPTSVLKAHDFYNQSCDNWGGAAIYKAKIGEEESYVVRVTTDGDDGWVEVYDGEGQPLAAGRSYMELVAWGEVGEVRSYVHGGGYPAELDDRQTRTMWVGVMEEKARKLSEGGGRT